MRYENVAAVSQIKLALIAFHDFQPRQVGMHWRPPKFFYWLENQRQTPMLLLCFTTWTQPLEKSKIVHEFRKNLIRYFSKYFPFFVKFFVKLNDNLKIIQFVAFFTRLRFRVTLLLRANLIQGPSENISKLLENGTSYLMQESVRCFCETFSNLSENSVGLY